MWLDGLWNRFGWWRDEPRRLSLNWVTLPGDPAAVRPENLFILWRWLWRLLWDWHIFKVEGGEFDYRLVFRNATGQRISRRRVRTPFICVRIGPDTTDFGLVSGSGESGSLIPVAGPLSRVQVMTMTDEELARGDWVTYYHAQLF